MRVLLARKIDDFLKKWKENKDKMPLVIKGARQIGKTLSISLFGERYYENMIIINFVLQSKFKKIFDDGFEVDQIMKNISLIDPYIPIIPYKTLIFFDELQACPNCATSLKSFKTDGRFDVICAGSLTGVNHNEIESNSVGYKEDYTMHSLDFEEFLWAKGYNNDFIEALFQKMINLTALSDLEYNTLMDHFKDYMILGGMPAVVSEYIKNSNFSGILPMQKQLLLDYEEDITKYAIGLDKGKIKNIYNHISTFLGKDNKKFQITKVYSGARNRSYIGTVDWLNDAGIINICYCLSQPELPLKGNYDSKDFKLYYRDTGLLIASLDEEAQDDLRLNKNFNTYKGAIYENIVADMLVKQGYSLFYYKNEKSTIEMDFFVRDKTSLIPVEVKSIDGTAKSLNKLIDNQKYLDIKYGIKFGYRNIGYNQKFYTFPYFLVILLKRFLREK